MITNKIPQDLEEKFPELHNAILYFQEKGFKYREVVAPEMYWIPVFKISSSDEGARKPAYHCELYNDKDQCIVREILAQFPGEDGFSEDRIMKTRKRLVETLLLAGVAKTDEITKDLHKKGMI